MQRNLPLVPRISQVTERRYDAFYDPTYTFGGQRALQNRVLYRNAEKYGGPHFREVAGSQRFQYSNRPIVPFMHSVPPEVILTRPENKDVEVTQVKMEQPNLTGKVDASTQSDYRDSEAQTDPYLPDYQVRPGEQPEIITLENLSYGNGLPVGEKEIQMIERARAKREFKANLPPTTDEYSFEMRRKLMTEQELREWKHRENELDNIQARKLQMLKEALYARDRENDFLQEQRVETLRQNKLEEKDLVIADVQRRRIKTLRKLSIARKKATPVIRMGNLQKTSRDIIQEFTDYGSTVYVPRLTDGSFPKTSTYRDLDMQELRTTSGLTHLQEDLNAKGFLDIKISRRKKKKGSKSGRHGGDDRKAQMIKLHLERVNKMIEEKKRRSAEGKGSGPEFSAGGDAFDINDMPWKQHKKVIERPPVPEVPRLSEEDKRADEFNLAVVFIQKLLRGRAIQQDIYEGKERRLDLIHELQVEEDERFIENAEAVTDKHIKAARDAASNSGFGSVISSSLDFFASELKREQEMQKIVNISNMAHRIRRKVEAEESGRRQAEENVRQKRDYVYRNMMAIHNSTAESFYDSICKTTVESYASREALSDVMGEKSSSESLSREETDNLAQKLLSDFVYPQVETQVDKYDEELRKPIKKVAKDVVAETIRAAALESSKDSHK